MNNTKYLILVLLLSSLTGQSLRSQSKAIPDFSVTDVYGFEHNLYEDYLDKGQYVFLDFFWNSCGGCQESAPKVDSVYRELGCNTGDIVFIAVDRFSPDREIWDFKLANNMSFPAVSGEEGGGEKVHLDYGIQYVPYFMLIAPAPDYAPVIDAYSIQSTQELRDTLNALGFTETLCAGNSFDFYALTSETDSVAGSVFPKNNYVEVMYDPENAKNYSAFFVPSGNAVVTINGEEQINGQSIIDPSQGTINYLITAENGDSEEWTVEFLAAENTSSIAEPALFLSPNPIRDKAILTAISRQNSKANLTLSDINGRILYSENNIQLSSGENRIEIKAAAKLPKGIYFLSLTGKRFQKTIRLVR